MSEYSQRRKKSQFKGGNTKSNTYKSHKSDVVGIEIEENNTETVEEPNKGNDFFINFDVEAKSQRITTRHLLKSPIDMINLELQNYERPITSTIISQCNPLYTNPTLLLSSKIFVKRSITGSFFKAQSNLLQNKMQARLSVSDDYEEWFDGFTVKIEPESSKIHECYEYDSSSSNIKLTKHVDPTHSTNSMENYSKYSKDESLLEIQIESITFYHHPLFTIEHVLSQKLIFYYDKYYTLQKGDYIKEIENKLRVSRNTRSKLISEMEKFESQSDQKRKYSNNTLWKYCSRINSLKQARIAELENLRMLECTILQLWKAIKVVRHQTNYSYTKTSLVVNKTEVNKEEHRRIWEDESSFEFEDILANLKYNVSNNTDTVITQPTSGEIKQIRKDISANLAFLPDPTKPNLHFTLTHNKNKIKVETENLTEKLKAIDFKFILMVDDKIIYSSDVFHITNTFTADLGIQAAFQLTDIKKEVSLILLQDDSKIFQHILNIPFHSDIECSRIHRNKFVNDQVIESSDYSVGCGLAFISMTRNSLDSIELDSLPFLNEKLYIEGEYTFRLRKVGTKLYSNLTLDTNETLQNVLSNKIIQYKNDGTFDMEKINLLFSSTIKNNMGSVTTIRMSHFENTLNKSKYLLQINKRKYEETSVFNENNRFIRDKFSKEVKLSKINSSNSSQYEKNITNFTRFKLDKLDLQRFISLKYLQQVALYVNSITKKMDINREDKLSMINEKLNFDHFEFISRVKHQNTFNSSNLIDLSHTTKNFTLKVTVIKGFCLPERTITSDHSAMNPNQKLRKFDSEIFKIAKLRPFIRVSCQENSRQTSCSFGSNPTWNQTLNLPIKYDQQSQLNIHLYDEVQVNFNEYGDIPADGKNSVHYRIVNKWLASNKIPIQTIFSLGKLEGTFKMQSPPIIIGYTSHNNSIQDIGYIKEFDMPLHKNTVYVTMRFELIPTGWINTAFPLINAAKSLEIDILDNHLKDCEANFAKRFPHRTIPLTSIDSHGQNKCLVKFIQPIAPPNLDNFENIKIERIESAISKSSNSSRAKIVGQEKIVSSETKKTSKMDDSPKWYSDKSEKFSPNMDMLHCTNEVESIEELLHKCARYVSLIPTYEHSKFGSFVLNGLELLKILRGSSHDHTILLASYFLHLGVKCWIVIGKGLPRGYTSYVLIRYNRRTKLISLTNEKMNENTSMLIRSSLYREIWKYIVYDATTAFQYNVKDPFCPLNQIFLAFNTDNIWLNIQQIDRHDGVKLDFSRTSDWQAIFNKNVPNCITTSPIEIVYIPPINTDNLRQRIEDKIQAKIQKWRSQRRTIWNRYCSSVLRENLYQWEKWSYKLNESLPGDTQRLKQLNTGYDVFGFPLNFPYTNVKAILSSIKATAISMDDNPAVEFGLAVEIYSYPNSVLSVWVFLATFVRK